MWVFSHFFRNVHATKPAASRNESAEIFVVCLGYKAPEKIDPKFLDSRHVFSEVEPIESSKKDELINPERKKKAPAEGYETGQTLLYNKVSFIYYVGICVNSTPLNFYDLIFQCQILFHPIKRFYISCYHNTYIFDFNGAN